MSKNYSLSSYDKYLSLKVNGTMWLIILFLLRPFIVTLISVTNRTDKMMLINMIYPDRVALSLGAFAGVPVALLVYAWSKRVPDAPSFVRRVWIRGRELIAITTILNACIVFIPLWTGSVHKLTVFGWGQLAISLLIVVVVYRSEYIKDCFSDWPKSDE